MLDKKAGRSEYILFFLLLCFIVSSALLVVYNAYQNRQLYIELNKSVQQYAALEIEYGRLLLEESTWSSPAQIERAASSQLGMQIPAENQLVIVPFQQ